MLHFEASNSLPVWWYTTRDAPWLFCFWITPQRHSAPPTVRIWFDIQEGIRNLVGNGKLLIKTLNRLRRQINDQEIGSRFQNAAGRYCYRCGYSNHTAATCKFKDTKCLKCGKQGHITPASQTSKRKQSCTPRQKQKTHHLEADVQSSSDVDSSNGDFKLHRLGKNSSEPFMVSVWLNGQKFEMEVDTGAAFSIISEATRQAVFPNQTLHPSDLV